MPSLTQAKVYLLTTLEFSVGSQPVKFYGAIQATAGKDLYFVLSDSQHFVPTLPAGDATTSISHPFGMTGVELTAFDVTAHIYKQDNSTATAVDLSIFAAVRFPNIQNLQLKGALVVDKTTPRLAWVELDAAKPLTLTQFVHSVIGGSWDWMDDVTNQFAFQSGDMYYLDGSDNYTFNSPDGDSIACSPGYHIQASLQIFQKYNFDIGLDVAPDNTILLITRVKQSIGSDLVHLDNLDLAISTGQNKYFRISATAVVLNTPIDIIVNYANSTFTGDVTFEGIDLTLSFSNSVFTGQVTVSSLNLTVGFSRSDDGFAITEISGLPIQDLNLIEKYLKVLNDLRGGGCQQIVGDWLNKMSSTKLTPALNGTPSKVDGKMQVPLKLTYEIDVDGSSIASSEIDFTAIIDIPSGVKDLPRAIGQSILDSAEQIAGDILSNPNTYKAIALEAAKRGAGKALARFICRALEEFEEVAKELAEAAGEVAVETLADAAELAGALMAVSLLGVKLILNAFEEIWDEVKHWFTGGKTDKEKAEDKVREVWDKVKLSVVVVDNKIADIKSTIKIVRLGTDLNEQKQFIANVVWNESLKYKLDAGSSLSCIFKMLTGNAGDSGGQILPGTVSANTIFPVIKNWADIPDNAHYRMNAGVLSILSGFTFMNSKTKDSITSSRDTLRSFGDDVANDFADYLDGKLNEFQGYNDHGIISDWVYAQSDFPSHLVIGKSRIGMNTRISGS